MARLLRGYVITGLENVALWHERDISHSSAERVIMPDATIALNYMLTKLEYVIRTLQILPEQMKKNMEATHGLIHSQQVLLKLTDKNISREKAYRIVQRNAHTAWEKNQSFKELLKKDAEVKKCLTSQEINDLFDIEPHIKNVNAIFKKVGL